MNDEEFVKLRLWLDAEIAMTRGLIAVVLICVTHSALVHIALITYVIWNIFYAAARINWIEKRHKGYTQIPKY